MQQRIEITRITRIALAVSLVLLMHSSFGGIQVYAKTSYQVKENKLVNPKTGKTVTKTVVYKGKLYKKGIVYKKKTVYKGNLYQNGKLAKGTKIYKKKMYINGIYKKDKTKPVLTLSNPQSEYVLTYGKAFKLPTATAKDKISGKVNVKTKIQNDKGEEVKKLDTTLSGIYTITFMATDYEKNTVTKKITVEVSPAEQLEVIEIY
ncbi:immunoglobulin-like domain-containing protein [Rummeliibacillus pycnus]|uniref:immunoglobulin-like domain-containing protein n=1 Tax=Rummeliibacillus pycnus TaxID=101070 RepID=UPI003D2821D7